MNALNLAVFQGLHDAWTRFRDEEDAWVAILTGNGRAFCAGADLSMMSEMSSRARGEEASDGEGARQERINIVTPRSLNIFKPTIAAVNGYALAGGFWMAMDCHLCLAAEEAEFGITEPRWNLPGGWAADVTRHLNMRHAIEVTIVPKRITAQRAYEMGFVNWVVPRDQLLDKAFEVAASILENAPAAVRAYIETFYRTYNLPYEQAMSFGNHIQSRLLGMDDAKEGTRAFLEKRKPDFKNR
jgi:enoyl-CoA hydratase